MPTYLPYAELDLKLENERARLTGRLRALADALGGLPIERLADVLPSAARPIDEAVSSVRQLGVYLALPIPEAGASGLATGPVDPRWVLRET